ncbi:effector-associated constant component EACC1 [Micromonospora profundi]
MPDSFTLALHSDRPVADAQRSLASWLRADDRLHGTVTAAAEEEASVLLVAVGDAGVAMVLVQALAGWLTHRRDDVTVTLSGPAGWSAELDVPRARDMGQVTALVEAAVHAVAAR